MSRFRLYRWWVMRRRGGFWVRKPHWADLPFLPLFPWRWIEPGKPYDKAMFIAVGCVIHEAAK